MKKGWHSKKLGDVCNVLKRGISPKYIEEGGICVLNQKCIRNHAVSFEPSRRHDIFIKKVPDERFVQLGDVLVNSTGTGTLGRVAQIRDLPPEQTTVDSHVTIVRPNKALFHLDFFGYAMIMIEEEIKNAGEGCGGQTELARSTLAEKFFVRFPEEATEQKRIVGILDATFKAIDIAKANTKKNLHNARSLFESYLNEIFLSKSRWQIKSLSEICTIKPPKSEARVAVSESDMVSFIPMVDLQINSKTFSHYSKRPLSDVIKSYTYFAEGDVLLAKITPCFENGKLGIAKNLVNGIGFGSSEFLVFRPSQELSNEWLYYCLVQNAFRIEGAARMTGAVGHKRVAKEFIENYQIPLPPIEKQKCFIEKIDSLSLEIQNLESIYQKKLKALEELKKSLLHQAFCGGL